MEHFKRKLSNMSNFEVLFEELLRSVFIPKQITIQIPYVFTFTSQINYDGF